MQEWPSSNWHTLMGKVSRVTKVCWEDGSASVILDIVTRKQIVTPTGWKAGWDYHQTEISPPERVLEEVWPGAIVMVQGPSLTYRWKARDSKTEANRNILKARLYQLIRPSDRPRQAPRIATRTYRPEMLAGGVRDHDHHQTEDMP